MATSSISAGPSRPEPLRGPCERRGNRVGIGAVDGDAGHAVPGRLVGKHARCGLIHDRRRQRGLIVLDAETAATGGRRTR